MRVILYDRVSTEEQGESGLGQAAQRSQMEAYASFKGWQIVGTQSDVVSSKKKRPGLDAAIAACCAGEADVLLAAKLSRISRGVIETLTLLERSAREGWGIVALDADLDTTTPTGKLVASLIASVNEYERNVIAERTRDALQAAKAQGVKLGRPRLVPEATRQEAEAMYGLLGSFEGVASALNQKGYLRPNGRPWNRSSVYKVVAQ